MAKKQTKKVVVQTVKAPLAERAKQRASSEFCHLCGGVVVAAVLLFGVYRFCDGVVRTADKAIRFVGTAAAAEIPAGITFAPDYETAEPMDYPDRTDIRALADDSGRTWNVDPLLLLAIAFQESSGNVLATNGNTRGLMQLTQDTRRRLRVTDDEAHDTRQSLEHSAYLLALKRKEQHGDMTKAIESYRCGNSVYTVENPKGCLGSPLAKSYRVSVGKKYQELIRGQLGVGS